MNHSKEDRKLRQARYLVEDFREAIDKLRIIGYTGLLMALLLSVSSFSLGASSYLNAAFSLSLGLGILATPALLDLEERSMIYFLIVAYFVIIAVEGYAVGLPDPLIPGLVEVQRMRVLNVVVIFNDLTPIVYYVVRIAVGFLFFRVLTLSRRVEQLPEGLRGRLKIRK